MAYGLPYQIEQINQLNQGLKDWNDSDGSGAKQRARKEQRNDGWGVCKKW